MAGPRVLRVFRFRPTTPEFDHKLRTVLIPELTRLPGVIEVFAGRRELPGSDERVVASIWLDQASMTDAVGEVVEASPFHPELLVGSTDRSLVVCELLFGDRAGAEGAIVLRLVEGTVRAGQLPEYTVDAQAGMEADRAAGRGPTAFYLGQTGDESFVTVSLWEDWATLQHATGGDIERPIATRHAERLIGWTASHYEAINADRPQVSRPAQGSLD